MVEHEDDGASFELEQIPAASDALDSSPSTGINSQRRPRNYTSEEERAVIRKLDLRLVLFIALLYLLSFLDRSNIGNARIAGLTEDLNLSSSQYEWLLTSFYITYISFQWMTLLYHIIPAHMYISLCVASWSVIASLQSVTRSFVSMLILRALLGVGEAAFSPGIPFLLSFFFKREELALRTGLFISAAPLATSFAGSLAWLITKVGEHAPIAAWRLLFLVEGCPAIIVAVIAWYQIPDNPHTARYLTPREKVVARLRLKAEKGIEEQVTSEKSKLDWNEIGQALTDSKCWITAMMFFSCNVAFSSLPPFLPTIINEMNYSALTSQALSAPPYLVAFVVVLLTAFLSDRSKNRSYYIIFHAILGGAGYLFIAIAGALKAASIWRYIGVYPAASGFFSAITLILAWTINNQNSDSKRGTGVVLLNVLGQFGPLLGTRLYPDSDRPYYVKGMAICSGFMLFVAILAWVLRRLLARENERWKSNDDDGLGKQEEEGLVDGDGPKAQRHFMNML
ncbi:hypothetical protein MMC20_005128 [Loxospora ochrophaea]|nr:hypothetical protein [Loxospora ochrophaea]